MQSALYRSLSFESAKRHSPEKEEEYTQLAYYSGLWRFANRMKERDRYIDFFHFAYRFVAPTQLKRKSNSI